MFAYALFNTDTIDHDEQSLENLLRFLLMGAWLQARGYEVAEVNLKTKNSSDGTNWRAGIVTVEYAGEITKEEARSTLNEALAVIKSDLHRDDKVFAYRAVRVWHDGETNYVISLSPEDLEKDDIDALAYRLKRDVLALANKYSLDCLLLQTPSLFYSTHATTRILNERDVSLNVVWRGNASEGAWQRYVIDSIISDTCEKMLPKSTVECKNLA